MSYVQTDRSKVFSVIDNGDGTFSQSTENFYASTPGMLDIDFMEAYMETRQQPLEGDNIYQFADGVQTIHDHRHRRQGRHRRLATDKTKRHRPKPGSFLARHHSEAEQKTYWAGQTGERITDPELVHGPRFPLPRPTVIMPRITARPSIPANQCRHRGQRAD